jgi:DNA-directed RNA polymerase specialized sigma subunit
MHTKEKRNKQILNLHYSGWSTRRIARVMDISHIRAWYIIKREIKRFYEGK